MRSDAADEGPDAIVASVTAAIDLVSAHTLTTGDAFTGDLPRLAVVLEAMGTTTTTDPKGW